MAYILSQPKINLIVYAFNLNKKIDLSIIKTRFPTKNCSNKQRNVIVLKLKANLTLKISQNSSGYLFLKIFDVLNIHLNIKRVFHNIIENCLQLKVHNKIEFKLINIQISCKIINNKLHHTCLKHVLNTQIQLDDFQQVLTRYILPFDSNKIIFSVYRNLNVTCATNRLKNILYLINFLKNQLSQL